MRSQTLQPNEIIVTDNASHDGSPDWIARHAPDVRLVGNDRNVGYSAGHNHAFRLVNTEFVLALNCDVQLHPNFLAEMVSALDQHPHAGSASGRITRAVAENSGPQLDSTGLFPDRWWRFRDRDHGMADTGQRSEPELIFGPSGSAAFFRRDMLEDTAFEGEYFDEDFFAYCEDADLSWRALRRGWDALFVPAAMAGHVHEHTADARSGLRDAATRYRQLLLIRNRRLCLLKNARTLPTLRRLPRLALYDTALQAYVVSFATSSAVPWTATTLRLLPRLTRKRAVALRGETRRVNLSDWCLSGESTG